MKREPVIERYKGANSLWYWRLKGGNGETVCDGAEGYASKQKAGRAARRVIVLIANAEFVDVLA